MTKINQVRKLFLIMLFVLVTVIFSSGSAADLLLQIGSTGSPVIEVQRYLYQLKYIKAKPDGVFGKLTAEAVKSFQMEHGLVVDGMVGSDTLSALRGLARDQNRFVEYTASAGESLAEIAAKLGVSEAEIIAANNLTDNSIAEGRKIRIPAKNRMVASRSRSKGIAQAIPWTIVNQLWANGEVAQVFDLATGKTFKARRYYGYYHADVEPLTAEDTLTMLRIYGGKWSWERRAVIVQLKNLSIAASINGMPHGGESIYDNNFKGQFCAHFLGSRVHQNGQIDPVHQEMVERASAWVPEISPMPHQGSSLP